MSLIVQKYGGSSLADVEKIKNIAKKVINRKREGNKLIVIVSAMGKTTDKLVSLSNEISKNPSKRELDRLLATGEEISMSLLAMAIQDLGEGAVSLTGPQAGIMTDSSYSKAKIVDIVSDRLNKELENENIIIVAGFQGQAENFDITTLGRGGSDTSAVSIAAALKADVCEIYTDVDGVYATDPRIVKNIKKLSVVSYDEMLELANLGAGVLHPRSVEVAKSHSIAIHVRSSFNNNVGTIINKGGNMEHSGLITGIAHDLNICKLVISGIPDKPGTAALVFKELAGNNIIISMIVQSTQENNKNDIAFTCSLSDAKEAEEVLKNLSDKLGADGVEVFDDIAKVSIVGAGMMTHSDLAARMFSSLGKAGINIDMISTSEITISVIIDSSSCENAVRALSEEFELVEK